MSSTRAPGGIVHRGTKTHTPRRGHKKNPKAHAASAKPAATGTLTIEIVSASIFATDVTAAPHADSGRSFDVTLRPTSRAHSKAKVLVRQSSTVGPLVLAPGTYQISVAEHVSKGVFQKYPEAACQAVVKVSKSTTAYAVLANDMLRDVADSFGARVGVLVSDITDENNPTNMLTAQYEFNLVTVCLPPGSMQPNPPNPATWFSAKLVSENQESAVPGAPDLDTVLAANGWATARFGPLMTKLLAAPFKGFEILPSPVAWFTLGQIGAWLEARNAHADPPPYKLIEDHAETVVLWIKKLVAFAETQPASNAAPENKVIRQWVAVNELEDTADTEFWGGIPNHGDLTPRLTEMAKNYLSIVHKADPEATLLMNDFDHEFYPPSAKGAKRKLAHQIKTLASHYNRTGRFHRTMRVLQKDHALGGKLAAGYQMHFPYSSDYLASPALYRGALANGIKRLRQMGASGVTITEMAVSILCFLGKRVASKYKPQPKTDDKSWLAERNTLYAKHGYAATTGTAMWRSQAQVFRDIVKTYFTQHGCKTLAFWGIADNADDDVEDLYGHLFDSVVTAPAGPAGVPPATVGGVQGAYAGGAGCARKPAYFGVLNGLIDASYKLHPPHKNGKTVYNWMRTWSPT